jgi:hypothetical protein
MRLCEVPPKLAMIAAICSPTYNFKFELLRGTVWWTYTVDSVVGTSLACNSHEFVSNPYRTLEHMLIRATFKPASPGRLRR